MEIIDKSGIVKLLTAASGSIDADLPADIEVFIENGVLHYHVKTSDINMQDNRAAFESWVIVLKAYLPEIKYVEVDFTEPQITGSNHVGPDFGHYNRFLYRLHNMTRLFPDWFFIASSKKKIVSDFMCWLASNRCLLNHSMKDKVSVIGTKHKERETESWFAFEDKDKLIYRLWDIDEGKLFIQVPVGVFYNEIATPNIIFPGGNSAIDLLGISCDGEKLHLIELKRGKNTDIGVISEILFYTAVIYDTCVSKNPLFAFGRYKNTKDTKEMLALRNGGKPFRRLAAHILAEGYHSLFKPRVEEIIAVGLSSLGIGFSRQLYDYEKKALIP